MVIIVKPRSHFPENPKEYLIRYATQTIERLKNEFSETDPDYCYHLKMVIAFHEHLFDVIKGTKVNSFTGFIQLINNSTLEIYSGKTLLTFNENIKFPPKDIKALLNFKSLYKLIAGYFDIIDSFYTLNKRGRLFE